jgi:diguanylate cyclase (GGDEF)-like protein
MIYLHQDVSLLISSMAVAFIACYLSFSLEQRLFRHPPKKLKVLLLLASGGLLGLAMWIMPFLGMTVAHFPDVYQVDRAMSFSSYMIGVIAATFSIWLTTRRTLPHARLILGAVLLGLGMSGMHFVAILGLNVQNHVADYHPLLMIRSILIAMGGAALSFWLAFKYRQAVQRIILIKLVVASLLTLTIFGMHYSAMAALSFYEEAGPLSPSNHEVLYSVLLVSALILLAASAVALLELRFEFRSRQLLNVRKKLASQAIHDPLTRLPNRLYLTRYTQLLFAGLATRQHKIAFVYIDLDRFKAVNDVFGYQVGDQLLIQLTQRIHRFLGEESKLLRMGGDEFLLVLENTSPEQASQISEQILALIQESFLIDGKTINISGSLGIALYPEHGQHLQDLLINADAAMLSSKDQGRNSCSVFSFSTEQHENKNQTRLMSELYRAVEQQQFVLFYQPKFRADEQLCGVEALIRWQHPVHGLLAPNLFIPGAEKTGLIIQIGYWVLEQACKQIRLWESERAGLFPIAVNLSAIQFEHKDLFSSLERLLNQYQIKPQHLMIEITESTAMHHIDASIQTLERLRQMGIQLAIDDFGTGHSSFLYLKNLPVDELKIDKEFIHDLSAGSKEEMILESMIQLAIKLGLKVTAEGVETAQQVEILTRLGCQQMQGYLHGQPMAVEGLEARFLLS